jgi:hypothetical protein
VFHACTTDPRGTLGVEDDAGREPLLLLPLLLVLLNLLPPIFAGAGFAPDQVSSVACECECVFAIVCGCNEQTPHKVTHGMHTPFTRKKFQHGIFRCRIQRPRDVRVEAGAVVWVVVTSSCAPKPDATRVLSQGLWLGVVTCEYVPERTTPSYTYTSSCGGRLRWGRIGALVQAGQDEPAGHHAHSRHHACLHPSTRVTRLTTQQEGGDAH